MSEQDEEEVKGKEVFVDGREDRSSSSEEIQQ